MSHEPFDEMKRHNPVSGDSLPGAPMAMAERIMSRRAHRGLSGWASAAVAAASVAVIGFGLLWFLGDRDGGEFAGGGTTTSPTTAPLVTTVVDVDAAAAVYFFIDSTGPGAESGPYLIPIARSIDVPDPIAGALEALLAGPTADEAIAIPAFSSAIPAGTTYHGYALEDGIVTVDFSAEFGSGGGSLSMTGRLGQVVFTLDRLEGVDGVLFMIEGVPTSVFGGEGVTVDRPATYADFESLLPAVMIESPAFEDFDTANPLVAHGSANVFEATVSLALTDADGLIIWEGFTTATCGTGCRGSWEATIPYEVDAPQMGTLIAWEASAMDGSQTNVREHRVWLVPGTGTTPTTTAPTCSGTLASDLVEQTGLPEAVAAKRAAIHAAAQGCDWAALEELMNNQFSFSFGAEEDPILRWQQIEAEGDRVTFYLAELLNRPVGIQTAGDVTYYAWPSAFVTEWADVSEADREALRPLYDDEDFAFWAEFGGYIGYRVGIDADGNWVYFIAGD